MTFYEKPVRLTLIVPDATMKKIDSEKGYLSRNRYLVKLLDEYFDSNLMKNSKETQNKK